MDFRKAVLKRVAVWTVLGLVGGGFAADLLSAADRHEEAVRASRPGGAADRRH